MHAALIYDKVSIHYHDEQAPLLREIQFCLQPGERAALVGLNGSGKTTLLMATVGLVPHDGTIYAGDIQVTAKTLSAVRENIGFLFNVPEDQLLFPTVLDDVTFGLRQRGIPAADANARGMEILKKLKIEDLAARPLPQLSHGQKQRTALAGALVVSPPLLLLDEPTAGLDPLGKRALAGFLTDYPAAMLITTHDLDFADQVCNRVLVLHQGRLLSDTTDTRFIRQWWDTL